MIYPNDGYCGTGYASRLLGISIGTVLGLVEKGELMAWKTQGGHRRIYLQAIKDYQSRKNFALGTTQGGDHLRVFVVGDDRNTRSMLQANFAQWSFPLDVFIYVNPIQAMLDMPTLKPQVLLIDLRIPNIDGFEFLKTLRAHNLFNHLTVVAMTGMGIEDVRLNGRLPNGVQLLQKPIDMAWLRGFFDAFMCLHNLKFQKCV